MQTRSLHTWIAVAAMLVLFSCQKSGSGEETDSTAVADTPEIPADNTLTEAESAAGWQLLFDGSTLNE